jgi:hypothetical protein
LVELKTKTEQAKRPSECVPHARVCAAGFRGALFLPISACQSILKHMEADCMQLAVSKAKSAEIEKFERKKTGARAGVRHVS